MKKSLIIYLISFLLPSLIFGQSTFQKDIGLKFDTSFIRCVPDGKAVFVVGQIKENNKVYVHFLKINSNGDLLWHKDYYLGDGTNDLRAVLLQNDGLIALSSTKEKAFILKIDVQNGTFLWRKDFGQKAKIELYDATLDDKENIWVGGLHYKETSSDSNYYFHLKLNKNGVPIMGKQARTYYNGPNFLDDRAYKPTNLLWNPFIQSMIMVQDYPIGGYTKTSFPQGNLDNVRFWLAVADTNMRYQEYILPPEIFDWVMTRNYLSLSGYSSAPIPSNIIGLFEKDCKRIYKWRNVDGKTRSISNYDGSIVYYNLKYKSLTKYNDELEPIWTKKYDNCYNTTNFAAEIAQDGSIFTVRNVAEKTVVSRINGDGTLPNCIDYTLKSHETPNPLINEKAIIHNFINSDFIFPQIKDSISPINNKNMILTDYCIKIDANFQIPDTLCVNTAFTPQNVDTFNAKHEWEFRPNFSDIGYPSINYTTIGQKSVYHFIQKGLCKDSISKFISIIPEPIVNLNDTVICGRKDLQINLTSKYAKEYFINTQLIKPIYTIDSSGIYNLKITTKACSTEKKVKIKINNYPIPEFKQIGLPCNNEAYPIVFNKAFKNIIFDGKLINSDTVFVNNAAVHTYSMQYKLDSNCVEKGTIKIDRKTCTDIFISTAFSPNNDQINDALEAFPQSNFKILSMTIFDRWGEQVFVSTDANRVWDGTFKGQACGEGTYVYVVKYLNIKTLKEEIVSGDVALVR
jgi:gliding motility-associated-like protein